jgi:hypothetical protein
VKNINAVNNTLDDYHWLTSPAAQSWLAEPAADPARLIPHLRKALSASRAHLIVETLELRHRARDKFRLADQMFFTRKGLEQATDEIIAAHKARRFDTGVQVSDFCCGIGGDFLALAARGPARGVDRDEALTLLAAANARAYGVASDQCSVVATELERFADETGPWHCDPDRRPTGHRATRGELFEPTLETLTQLIARRPHAAIKLAPATQPPDEWTAQAECEWIESRGECRQQVAWFGNLARSPGQRAATILADGERIRTVTGNADDWPPVDGAIRRYLYEPAAAVLAAKLVAELCREHSLAALGPGVAYLTGDEAIHDLALAAFEVLDVLPFDRKQLRAYCRQHHFGRLEIKKRGIDIDPNQLQKELSGVGEGHATILIAPHAGKTRAIIARRVLRSVTAVPPSAHHHP